MNQSYIWVIVDRVVQGVLGVNDNSVWSDDLLSASFSSVGEQFPKTNLDVP